MLKLTMEERGMMLFLGFPSIVLPQSGITLKKEPRSLGEHPLIHFHPSKEKEKQWKPSLLIAQFHATNAAFSFVSLRIVIDPLNMPLLIAAVFISQTLDHSEPLFVPISYRFKTQMATLADGSRPLQRLFTSSL